MNGVDVVAKESQKIVQRDISSWITLYYDMQTDTVYTTKDKGRIFITRLIRPNTEEDIVNAVRREMSL